MIAKLGSWKFCLTCAVLLSAWLSSAAVHAQSNTLRWKLKEGQTFEVVTVQKVKTSIDSPAGAMDIPMDMTVDMQWKVTEASDKEFKLEQTITRYRMNMTMPMGGGDVNIDTDNKEPLGFPAEMIAGGLKNMINVPFHMTMNGQGEIVKFEVPEEMTAENAAGGGQGFTPESVKQMAAMTFFPEKAVVEGDTWDNETTAQMPGMGEMTIANKFTYQGMEKVDGKDLCKIAVESAITLKADENAEAQFNMDNAKGKSTIYFDNVAGVIVRIVGDQNMEGDIDAGGQSMSMSTKIDSDTKFSSKK